MIHSKFNFTHYKLDAYRVARELADLVIEVTPQVPKDHQQRPRPLHRVLLRSVGASAWG